MIIWTQLYLQTHQFNEGAIAIASSFVGNVLAIAATTKPEYAESKQIIGYVFQDSGLARKGYALYSGKDILLLALPETSGLTFFPTNYLSDSYTLDISYASVGNILESNTAPIPDLILGLPVRVYDIESSIDGLGLAIESQTETDLSHASRLAALEGTISNPSWSDISDKPLTFPPSAHSHSIDDISGLGLSLGTNSESILDLFERVEALETATPPESGSIATISLTTDTTLESNKSYLATTTDLISTLPLTPSIGDLVSIATGNFNTKLLQNTSQTILNLATQTPVGSDTGLILKPYSSVQLMYVGSNLWVTQYRSRTINNWLPMSESIQAISYTPIDTGDLSLSPSPEWGTLSVINNNVIAPTGNVNSSINLGSIDAERFLRIDFAQPVELSSVDFYFGWGNRTIGEDRSEVPTTAKLYGGTTSNLLGTLSSIPSTVAVKRTLTPTRFNATYSTYFIGILNTRSTNCGIIEIDTFGYAVTGGETVAT